MTQCLLLREKKKQPTSFQHHLKSVYSFKQVVFLARLEVKKKRNLCKNVSETHHLNPVV